MGKTGKRSSKQGSQVKSSASKASPARKAKTTRRTQAQKSPTPEDEALQLHAQHESEFLSEEDLMAKLESLPAEREKLQKRDWLHQQVADLEAEVKQLKEPHSGSRQRHGQQPEILNNF